jgi:putative endonuclease
MSPVPRGRAAEEAARRFLETHGFSTLAVNYRSKQGEIDLICHEGTTLVLVEVKERAKGSIQELDRAIDRKKIQRILKTAEKYIEEYTPRFDEIRVDAVLVEKDEGEFFIRHIREFA